jgi:predicted RNA methylase
LGCGCGTLLLGAALLGAPLCVGVELDPKALEICRTNVAEVFGNENEGGSSSPVELVLGDATAPIFRWF